MTKRITEYARHDAAMAHAPLFRPLKKGSQNQRLSFEVSWNDATLTFASPYQYGIPEQSLFFAVCALAGLGGVLLSSAPSNPESQSLRSALQATQQAAAKDALRVQTTLNELLTAAGMPTGGSAYLRAAGMLARLSALTVRMQKKGWDGTMHLLSYVKAPDNTVYIALHFRLAEAIAGNAQYFRVNLIERRLLGGDAAKCLHAWLCAFIPMGTRKSIALDKLIPHIWPDACTDTEQRKRRKRTRAALQEIKGLPGWAVEESNGLFTVARP